MGWYILGHTLNMQLIIYLIYITHLPPPPTTSYHLPPSPTTSHLAHLPPPTPLTCPCRFMIVTELLLLHTAKWSGVFGSMWTELTVTSVSEPDSDALKVLTHSVVFRLHI